MRFHFALLVFLFLAVMWNDSYSLTIARASLRELSGESELIVRARVTSSHCDWANEAQKNIYTFADLEVIETLKGEKVDKITVRQLGGQIGDWGMIVSGTPYLQKDDEAIFFLVRNGDFFEIHSIALGLFRIFKDDSGNEKAVNDLGNIQLIDHLTGQEISPVEKIQTFEVSSLINLIKTYTSEE